MIWKGCQRRNDIFSLTLWVYVLARMCGFWPFSMSFKAKNRSSRVKVTIFDVIWFVFALVFYSVSLRIVTNNPMQDSVEMEVSFTEVALNQLAQYAQIFIILLCIVLDMVNRNVLWNIILKFKSFDDEMVSMGRLLNYRQHKICMVLTMMLTAIGSAVLVAFSVKVYDHILDITSMAAIAIIFLVGVLVAAHTTKVFIYLFLLMNVKVRFRQLNQCLEWVWDVDELRKFSNNIHRI